MDELRGYCETCGERLRPGDEIALVLLPPAAHGDYPLCRFGSVHLECTRMKAAIWRRVMQKLGLAA